MSLILEYAESLASLSGSAFEDEVCARLQGVILGFQTVPAKPLGDAGLDGLSHGGERGYCCYGAEHDTFKTNRSRETDIKKKFRSDLRRLFELDTKASKLVRAPNAEMETILPKGRRLKHIELISNWFESHRILGPISTALDEYKDASACRYVDDDASLVIVGPTELANRYAVDEVTIMRARQRVSIQRIEVLAQSIKLGEAEDFDAKIEILREIRPDQHTAIDSLADRLRHDWRMALAFERDLDETVPTLHKALEEHRGRILARAAALMLADGNAGSQIIQAEEFAKELLHSDFGKLYGALVHNVANGEIARLIGECPIGWQRPTVSDE